MRYHLLITRFIRPEGIELTLRIEHEELERRLVATLSESEAIIAGWQRLATQPNAAIDEWVRERHARRMERLL